MQFGIGLLSLLCLLVSLYAAGIYFHLDLHLPSRPSSSHPVLSANANGGGGQAALAASLRTNTDAAVALKTDKSTAAQAQIKKYEAILKELHDETARLERQIQDLHAHLTVEAGKAVAAPAVPVPVPVPVPVLLSKSEQAAKGHSTHMAGQAVREQKAREKAVAQGQGQAQSTSNSNSNSTAAASAAKAPGPGTAGGAGDGDEHGDGSSDSDNEGGRKHMVLESADVSKQGPSPARAMMVICGTDGSGTRKVVQVLADMGVLVVSEDPETYDIHGDLMGGWPTVVKPVVQNVKTLNYWPEDAAGDNNRQGRPGSAAEVAASKKHPNVLPTNVNIAVGGSLRRLIDQARRDSSKPQSFVLAKGGALPRPSGSDAKRVSFAFKAPVAMTLTPYWAHLEPHFKLLHVLRDGRDISFSANQSPVAKFYNDMYGRDTQDPRVKAIRLWSDWNSQVYDWATEYTTRLRNMYSGYSGRVGAGDGEGGTAVPEKTFSYMGFHSEDLVSESIQVRYRGIQALARWVGSTLAPVRLCCIAQSSAHFMGSHDRTSREEVQKQNRGNEQKELSKRYGKWHALVKQNPGLGKALDTAGKVGLELFGYEPSQDLLYPQSPSGEPFVCAEPTQESHRKCQSSAA